MQLYNENTEKISLIDSIKNQIQILLANRTDSYISYNNQIKKAVNLELFFKKKYLSDEFVREFSKAIEINDSRLSNVNCSILFKGQTPSLILNAKIKETGRPLKNLEIDIVNI